MYPESRFSRWERGGLITIADPAQGGTLMTRFFMPAGVGFFMLAASLPALANDTPDPAAQFAAECAQCHGRTGRGMASFPALRGKSEAYLVERLTSYRNTEQVGPNSMLMFGPASALSDAEIAALAAYIVTEFN